MKKLLLSAIFVTGLAACGPSTKIVHSWMNPEIVISTSSLNKFVVAALLKNETVRRRAEDEIVAMYPGKAVQSYKVFGFMQLNETDELYNAQLKKDGYDGVVIMRLLSVDKTQRYVPGSYPPYYVTWRGFYRYVYPFYHDPGYYTTDKTYYVEVNVYSLIRDKLVWSAMTSTLDPASGDELFNSVAKKITKTMKKEGILQ